jgi:hypothetical protein
MKLRQCRLSAGKDVADVTEARLGSKAKMSRIETGKSPVRVADVMALCQFYGVDNTTTAALVAMAPGTQQDEWWEASPAIIPGRFSMYVELEAAASEIRCFEPQYVHGLLQTEDYARAVMASDPRVSPDLLEERVRFRMKRQQRAMEAVTVIMGEGALALVVGSDEVMAAQADHLCSSPATIRVLPFRAGPMPGLRTWAMLAFDDEDDPNTVYIESGGGNRYLDSPRDWADHEFLWSIMAGRSIPIGDWLI